MRGAWTFTIDFANSMMAGVIGAINYYMILLAGLFRLPAAIFGIIGLTVTACQNLMDLSTYSSGLCPIFSRYG
jgi:hypothetical protein